MKLKNLKAEIDWIVSTLSDDEDLEVAIKVIRVGAIGGTPTIPVTNIFKGFDWDSGSVILSCDSELREIDRDEIKKLRESYEELGWKHYQISNLKKENKRLKGELEQLKNKC